MTRIHNTNDDRLAEIFGRSDTLETMAPMGHSAVPKGASRFIGNESLLVEGSQKVSGWLIVTGTLKVVGTFLLEGITTITGALTSSGTALFTGAFTTRGTTRFEGDTTQQGPFHIIGATDLQGTMSVKPGGKVIVEGASAATLQNGELSFATGGKLLGSSGGAVLNSGVGTGSVSVSGANAQIAAAGLAAYIIVTPTGITAVGPAVFSGTLRNSGMPTSPVSSHPGGFINAVVADSSGNLRRLVAG